MSEAVVHVVDDDESARESLAFLLEAADFEVVSHASALALLEALPLDGAGCVITDMRMPDMTGLELVRELNARGSRVPIIMITGHGDIPLAVEAMRAGVADFIEKPFGESRMLDALNRALEAGPRPEAAKASDEAAVVRQRLETLSERERQVLDGVVDGQPNKVIARELGISPRTVEIYRAKLMAKMHADNLAALVRMTLSARRG
ncbi:two-component system response regulator [Caulobacter sp. Root1455]|uniref:response regulator FixJ n=1 Tax=unclassified Caulobacter TaxID=2648921 RepID=UPI0006FE2654|nr:MULTISPECIES: response regulator FixJ [unclassified Caulobacter]KQY29420.1 two-component system response regulator [Caulobacter sp. Root487D2Y]KQY95991.1 two-component system response regulator [Caulobacter sp. Root1455]